MKVTIQLVRTLVVLFLFYCALSPCKSAVPEFTAFMKTGDRWLVVLTDKEDGSASGWLTFGQSFRKYKIINVEQDNEVLVLTDGIESLRIPLKGAKIVAARPRPAFSELKMGLAVTGALSLEGQPISKETLDELFSQLAQGTEGLRIVLQLTDWPKGTDISPMTQAIKDILRRMKAAGFSRGEVIHSPPPRGADSK